jgi:hypothetical protein
MGLVLIIEAWFLAVFGWTWLTVQDLWLTSLLCTHAYYGMLILATINVFVTSLFSDLREPRVAYFNTVLGLTLFYACCIAESFLSAYSLGGEAFRPVTSSPSACCSNCDIARSNRLLFFNDSPLSVVQAGILAGYLLIHLLVAGGQLLDASHRSIWAGCSWATTLATVLSVRCAIVFDGSAFTIIPDSATHLLLFSLPLLSLSMIFWALFLGFSVLAACEGIPTLDLIGFRVLRSINFGALLGFAVMAGVVFGMRGMLTMPLFVALVLLALGGLIGVLEAFLGQDQDPHSKPLQPSAPPRNAARVPFPIQMQGGKKAA